ncbi:MAG TPA: nuclear transport factor 2 family protein [Kribbella sp.]|jgi:hypothetical protein
MDAEQEVIAAAVARGAALAAGDVDGLKRLLHPAFRWTSHLGEVFDRDSYLRANTAGSLNWKKQSLSDPEVVIVGTVAVLRCLVTDEVDAGRGRERFRMPMTQTWVRTDGHWLCLAGHAGPRLTC